MFKKFNMASSLVGLHLLTKTVASSPYEVTVFDAENIQTASEGEPLSIRVSPEVLSPEVIEKLGKTSNIIFADLPNTPQFVSLKDYENMKFATNELVDELLQQNRANGNNNNINNNDNANGDDQVKDTMNNEQKGNYDSVQKIYDANLGEGDNKDEHKATSTSTVIETEPVTTITEIDSSCNKCSPTSSPESTSTSTSTNTCTSTTVESTPCTSTTVESESNSTPCTSTTVESESTSTPCTSTVVESSTSTESESCGHCSSTHTPEKTTHHQTTKSTAMTSKKCVSSTHPAISSGHNTSGIMPPKSNFSNHTNHSIGFHNSSNSIMPTTMLFGLLISTLVFAQIC